MLTATRLPGLQFEVVASPANDTLVRMDIAAFVGFAASGPLHLPVMVEDITRFEEIFGEDLALATASDSNQPVYAYLPSAVRAFFRNGGRRCWVVRVADTAKAESGFFPLPGLFRLDSSSLTQALAPARSPGSWSDSLVAGLSLESHPVLTVNFVFGSNVIGLSLSTAGEVGAGDLLRFSFPGSDDVLWFFVDSVDAIDNASPVNSRRGQLVAVTGTQSYWQSLSSPPAPGVLPVCERITMDLTVQREAGEVWNITGLGLAPTHPRYWGNLPDDATLFAADSLDDLSTEVLHPRFPLAGPNDGGFYLPLGITQPLSPLIANTQLQFSLAEPQHSGADELIRNGLSAFDASLFLDSALAETSSLDLLREAYYLRFQSPSPRRLNGIHATLEIEEATIIAAPDAVQRNWGPATVAAPPLPQFLSPLAHPEWWHFAGCDVKLDPPLVAEPPAGQFQPCNLLIVSAPVLALTDLGGGRYELQWTPLAGAVDYVEEAVDPAFASVVVKSTVTTGNLTIFGQPPGDYYYRVRRQIGSVSSNYSNGVVIRIDVAADWRQESTDTYNDQPLLAVQTALLRMSAARGDLFTVLAAPEHYRERETAAHVLQIKAALVDEVNALSFGSLYHPWLTGREEDDLSNLRTTPPDGAMAGIMAKRSSSRGPWISPANENLSGVVALSPAIPRTSRQLLQDAQVNLVRQEAAGFVCLCALTLTDDDDLAPISVRRLLSFLRKTALLVGNQYVFEPLSDVFRRGVQRGFENMLDEMARRGAFAGRTQNEQYQVVTDEGLNTSITADQGKFLVELRVAPSLPLRFLTIRLLQQADRTFVTEGR